MSSHQPTRDDEYFTVEEVCQRWKISSDTVNKLGLPWLWVAAPGRKGQIRRLPWSYVRLYEQQQQFSASTST